MQSASKPLHDGMVDASHLISLKSLHTSPIVCTIDVKPNTQEKCLLGEYFPEFRFKGFSVELSPDPEPEHSVVTQITNTQAANKHRLHLHVANYSNKTVTATVRQL